MGQGLFIDAGCKVMSVLIKLTVMLLFAGTMKKMTCACVKGGSQQGSGFGRWWPWSSDAGLCWVHLLFPSKFQTVQQGFAMMGCYNTIVAFQDHRWTDGSVQSGRFARSLILGPSLIWKVCQQRKPNVTGTVRWRRNGWRMKFLSRWKARFVVVSCKLRLWFTFLIALEFLY